MKIPNRVTLFIPLAAYFSLSAQSLSPALLSTAGQSHASSSMDVEWSLGEPVIGPFGDSAKIAQGFQQLDEQELPTSIVPAAAGLSRVRLQRMPGSVIFLFDKAQAAYAVRLFSGKGRNIRNFSVAKGQKELSIPARELASGFLLINVYSQDKKQVQNFKFAGGD